MERESLQGSNRLKKQMNQFAIENDLHVFCIMTADTDECEKEFSRQFMIDSRAVPLDDLVQELKKTELDLVEWEQDSCFTQRNVSLSRKQVHPILVEILTKMASRL